MQWNPLLSVLLFLHYFASYVCEFSSRNFNSLFQTSNYTNSGANASRFYNVDPKCSNLDSTLPFCQSQNQNSQNYQHYYNHNIPHSNQIHNQPVYYYSNPNTYDTLKSRVDEASSSHLGEGWGEAKGQTHQYHYKEKKQHKKGPLAKLLKKLKPKRKPEKLIWKEVSECDGFENFVKDVEILSLKLGWLGFKKATVAFILHILNQIYGFFSVVLVGLPERLATFVDLIVPMVTPEQLRIILAVFGILDYFVIFTLSYPLGNLILAIDTVAELLTLASLALASFAVFDDIVEEKVWATFGIDLRQLFEGYGCDNPFSKKQIE